jgi:tRNA A-37 threonylcarbamoyl transferase component Bud32
MPRFPSLTLRAAQPLPQSHQPCGYYCVSVANPNPQEASAERQPPQRSRAHQTRLRDQLLGCFKRQKPPASVLTDMTECLADLNIEDVPHPVRTTVDLSTVTLDERIGRGAQAKVYRAQGIKNGEKVDLAVKRFRDRAVELSGRETAARENSVLMKLNHENIVYSYGLMDKNSIVMDLALTDLHKLFKKFLTRVPDEVYLGEVYKKIAHQLINSIFYIYRNRFVHSDLKSDNVLYNKGGFITISDFGYSEELSEKHKYSIVSPDKFSGGINPFLFIKSFSDYSPYISPYDNKIIKKLCFYAEKQIHLVKKEKPINQHTERKIRDLFIELWSRAKEWGCITNKAFDDFVKEIAPEYYPAETAPASSEVGAAQRNVRLDDVQSPWD